MVPPFEHHDTAHGEDGRLMNAFFDCLADSDRRQLLRVLEERAPDAVTLEELATSLASRRTESSDGPVADEARDRLLASLHHVHLPKLEHAGLVEPVPERDAVALTDHPAFQTVTLGELRDAAGGLDQPPLDTLFEALASHRRRIVLDALGHRIGSMQAETLAREVCAAEHGVSASSVPAEAVQAVLVSLHHRHLPRLSDAELLEYDSTARTVTNDGRPTLRVPRTHAVLGPESWV